MHKQDGQREVMGLMNEYGRLRAGATHAEHVCRNATTSRGRFADLLGRVPFHNNFENFSAQVKITSVSLNNTNKKSLNGIKSSVRLKVKIYFH